MVKPIKLRRLAEQERLVKVEQEKAQKAADKITSQFVTDFLRMAGPIRKDVDIAICPVGDRVIIATYKRNGDSTVRLAVRGTLYRFPNRGLMIGAGLRLIGSLTL